MRPIRSCMCEFSTCMLEFSICMQEFPSCMSEFPICMQEFSSCMLEFPTCTQEFSSCMLWISNCARKFPSCISEFFHLHWEAAGGQSRITPAQTAFPPANMPQKLSPATSRVRDELHSALGQLNTTPE